MSLTVSDKHALGRDGFLFVPQFQAGMDADRAAADVGELLLLGEAEAVHELRPSLKDQSPPNTYSGNYGHGAFPFHTDLAHWRYPPRYLVLRCLKGFHEVPTLLIDGSSLVEAIGQTALRRALVQPRRPVSGRLPLLRLLDEQDGQPILRWDEVFIRAASRLGASGMERVKLALAQQVEIKVALVDEGDTLLVDNWRMLHARSVIPPGCESRILQRAYLGRLH